jgi:DDE superfamily endonuclease
MRVLRSRTFLWLTCGANMVSSRIGRTPSSYRKIRCSLKRLLTSSGCTRSTCGRGGAVVDEKSGVQALDRTQPLLPLTFDKTEKRTHDYVRHGTVNLFGALEVATGKVTGECYPRRGSEKFLAFMKTVAAQYVDREVHVVVDNLGTHFAAEVRDWLAANPNITFHRTPVGASWINQIEIWFGLITRQAIRRGTFSSIRQLITTIENYITNWNANCKPFAWTANADAILAKVRVD